MNNAGLVQWCMAALLALLLPRAAAAQSVWELTPYRVLFAVWTADLPEFTPLWQQDLRQNLVQHADATFGPAWETSTADCPADISLAALSLAENIPAKALPSEWLNAYDKLIVVRVAAADEGYDVRTREFDLTSQLWSPPRDTSAAAPSSVSIEAFRSAVRGFAPLAKVEQIAGKEVILQLRAAALPPRDGSVQLVPPQAVYRPVIRFNDRDGNAKRIQPIEWTFLVAQSQEGNAVTCSVESGLRNPLVSRVRGRTQQLALTVLPPREPTTLTLISRVDPKIRLPGFDVWVHPADIKTTTLLGKTDRFGAIIIPPPPLDEPQLRILLIKNGAEVVAKLPVMPGLFARLEATLSDDQERLALEGFITGLQEELVDTVAQREVLAALIHARVQKGEKAEAEKLLADLRALKTRDQFLGLLTERRKTIENKDPRVQRQIDKLFSDTQKVLNQHLDLKQIEDAAAEVAGMAAK
ncbi:MAG: hypothetical protein AB7O62_16230 [Pirellulales bacterium]